MNEIDETIVAAWTLAASDLGISVFAPFPIETDTAQSLQCEAFISDFGSSNGTLALSARSSSLLRAALPKAKFFLSELGDSYRN